MPNEIDFLIEYMKNKGRVAPPYSESMQIREELNRAPTPPPYPGISTPVKDNQQLTTGFEQISVPFDSDELPQMLAMQNFQNAIVSKRNNQPAPIIQSEISGKLGGSTSADLQPPIPDYMRGDNWGSLTPSLDAKNAPLGEKIAKALADPNVINALAQFGAAISPPGTVGERLGQAAIATTSSNAYQDALAKILKGEEPSFAGLSPELASSLAGVGQQQTALGIQGQDVQNQIDKMLLDYQQHREKLTAPNYETIKVGGNVAWIDKKNPNMKPIVIGKGEPDDYQLTQYHDVETGEDYLISFNKKDNTLHTLTKDGKEVPASKRLSVIESLLTGRINNNEPSPFTPTSTPSTSTRVDYDEIDRIVGLK